MNIFVLDRNPEIAASYHCDRHVVKMIVEYAQLLSTAHRLIDGQRYSWNAKLPNGRSKVITFMKLEGEHVELCYDDTTSKYAVEVFDRKCYNLTHYNHPSAVWARTTDSNYIWLVELFKCVLHEYKKRYGKIHASNKLLEFFLNAPKNIPRGQLTPFALAMPDQYKVDDEVISYQNYYVGDKARFAKWTNTPVPEWFSSRIDLPTSYFQRAREIL